jgi:predicted extracellular nuclease
MRIVLVLGIVVGALASVGTASAASNIVISQVYGGGGNMGATYQHDYVELFNRGTTAQLLDGWSLQYGSSTGLVGPTSTPQQITPLSGSIAPGEYVLVREAQGTGGTTATPGDITDDSPIAMSASAGKIALVNTTTNLACGSATVLCGSAQLATIVDLVGYGAANQFEGAGPTATLSNTTAALRGGEGCVDTDNNGADFAVGAPAPRNRLTLIHVCGGADTAPSVASTSPTNGATGVARDANVTITFSEPVDTTSSWYAISCGTTAGHTATAAGGPTTFTLDPATDFAANETCTVRVLASDVTDQDAPPDNMLANHEFTFQTAALASCGDPATKIGAIQGTGASAAITGNVTIEGIVVGDFEGPTSAGVQGFYLQDSGDGNSATSDGIFVYTGDTNNNVSPGQVLRVTGFARERFDQTTLNGTNSNTTPVTNIVDCGTTGSVAPTDVSMPFAAPTSPEQYEGMLVRFPQSLVISEYFNYDQFGELVLALPLDGEPRPFSPTSIEEPGAAANARMTANTLRRITLDDTLGGSNPSVLRHPNGSPFSLTNGFRGGDLVQNAVGVLTWEFSRYRIEPTAPADYTAVNPRPAEPEPVGGTLRTAAMNTLNFFITGDYATGNPLDNKCGPAQSVECRGHDATEPLEFTRQRDKLLAAVVGVNADVLGLNEIENTTGVDALTDEQGIVPGVNGILGAGTYAAIETGVIGTDAIRVGLIYKPAKVTPVGAFKVLSSTVDPRFIDTRSRPALAQTFEENATGARFTVIVNHLKSKGSSCADIGDPDVGDGQGNCNVTRTNAAKALVDWAATDPTGSGDPDFLIIGDLNSYAMEDPIDAIKAGPDDIAGTADDYMNLVAQYLGKYAYSYVFDGMAGYLDHALSNSSLTSQVTGVTEWHINSDEADVLDYDTSFKPPAQEALYEPKAYRTSDHDPILVGLDLTTSYADLRRLTLAYVDDADVAAALVDKLDAAESAEERGNERAKQAAIRAYVSQLRAQAGKSLTAAEAELLIGLAGEL